VASTGKFTSWDELKQEIFEKMDLIINYLDFMHSVNSDPRVKETVLKLRKLSRKTSLAERPHSTLTYNESIEYQKEVIPVIIEWQPDLYYQMTDFYNSLATFARLTIDPQMAVKSSLFAKTIYDNWDRLFTFSEFVEDAINKLNSKRTSQKDEDEVINLIKSLNETITKVFLEPLKITLKNVEMESKFDPYKIFSITRKFEDQNGQNHTDYQYIVDSLENSNFTISDSSEDPTYTFYGKSKNSQNPLVFTYHDLLEFLAHAKFQLLSFLCIVAWMSIMATVRKHFTKNRPCPKCNNGLLHVGYDKEMQVNRTNKINKHTFWKCDNCNQVIRDY